MASCLRYRTIAEWIDKEQVPSVDAPEMSESDRDLFRSQYQELYTKLWDEHYESLPHEVRQLFETKEHQRFHYEEEIWELRGEGAAKKYLVQLQQHLEAQGRKGFFKVTDSPFGDVRLAVL